MAKLTDILLKYPLKTTFGLLITIAILFATIFIFLIDLKFSLDNMKKEKLREVRVLSDNMYQLTNYFINTNDYGNLEKIIATFSAYSHVDSIRIIDKNNSVLLSDKKAEKGTKVSSENSEGCNFKNQFDIRCIYTLENGFKIIVNYNLSRSFKSMALSLITKHLLIMLVSILVVILVNFMFFKLIGEKVEKIVEFLKKSTQGVRLKPLRVEGNNEITFIAEQINQSYDKLWELINSDRLTKIPNRFFIENEFNKHKSHKNRQKFIALIDLDNFKELNDFFGHNFGDLVLINFAKRLEECVKEKNYLCGRLGGDEFVIFGCEKEKTKLKENLENIFNRISGDYSINDISFQLTASMGVSIKEVSEDVDFYDLLKEADISLYKSKEKGKNRIYILSKEEREEEYRKKKIYSELTLVTENRELFMVYQPIVDAAKNQIVGYESLVRWNSKKFGLISPGDFIPYLETTGQITKVGKYILGEVINAIIYLGKPVHVNVSSKQLFEKGFADYIYKLLEKNKIPPNLLVVEITETQEIPKDNTVLENLKKIKEHGIRLSLDDFGTGYSNLYTISQIGPDSLKIDIHLIKDVEKDKVKYSVVKAIKEMADALNIKVLAEGVESKEISDTLLTIGIKYMQGYYYGKPEKLNSY